MAERTSSYIVYRVTTGGDVEYLTTEGFVGFAWTSDRNAALCYASERPATERAAERGRECGVLCIASVPAWVITADHLDLSSLDIPSRVGVTSVSHVPADAPTVAFRLLDDDGELYYSGRIARSWLDGEEQRAFSPLDWARADAGCTEMQYRDGNSWKTL